MTAKNRIYGKKEVDKSRKKDEDEQLSDIIKIVFRFFDGLGLFSLSTLIAFCAKKVSGLRFALQI